MRMADRAEIDCRNVFTVDADLGGLSSHQGFQVELGAVTATIFDERRALGWAPA